MSRRLFKRQHFSVSRRIIQPDWLIMSGPDDLIVNNYDGANGDLTRIARLQGFSKREAHKEFIFSLTVNFRHFSPP